MKLSSTLLPHRVFLALAWSFGTLFAFLTPPFQVPDEYDHFHRAYQVSEGHLTETRRGNQGGGYLPSSLIAFQTQVSQGIPLHPDVKQNVKTLWAMWKMPLRAEDRQFVVFPWYAPTNYFPQGAAISIARHLGAGPLWLIYAGRLGNLLVWSLLIYCALRLTPILHWTLFLLALMPMSLWLAASNSADTVVNGTTFLFVATILRFALKDDRPMNARRLAALFLLGGAIALAKTAYLPLIMLFLLIPAAKFGGRARYWLAFFLFLGVSLSINVAWTLYTYQHFVNSDSSPRAQAIYLLHHPLGAVRDYVGQLFSIPFLCSIIGKLGWYDTRLFRPFIVIYAAILVWTARSAGDPEFRLNGRQRWIIACSAVCIWLAVFGLVDLAFTRVGARGITSLQGRYMVPLTPLVLLLFYPMSSIIRRREHGPLIAGFSASFCVYIVIALVLRFYVA